MNGNRADKIDMKFHVEVEAVGVEDDLVTIDSPEYHFTFAEGRRELRVSASCGMYSDFLR